MVSGLFYIGDVFCPACGRSSLYLNGRGKIECIFGECPRPTAAAEILADPETEHEATFTATGFTLRHPLRERLDNDLVNCEAHRHLAAQISPEMPPGSYVMEPEDGNGGWTYTQMERRRG